MAGNIVSVLLINVDIILENNKITAPKIKRNAKHKGYTK